MSADNGIYIGIFPAKSGGKDYRVIHAQAIENCDDSDTFPTEMTDWYRVVYYYRASCFHTADEALLYAKKLSDDYTILEYGIQEISYDRPLLKISYEDANKKLDEYWKKREAEKREQNKIEDAKRKVEQDKKEAEKKYLLDSISMLRRTDNSGMRHHERMLAVIDYAEAQLKK